jgi:hypothetical protein
MISKIRNPIAAAALMLAMIGCSSTKKVLPAEVAVVPFYNYVLHPDSTFADDIHYAFIENASDFHSLFHMTRSSPGSATVPDFSEQSVVAIILKPTEKVVTIDIRKAEIATEDLNIYYTITDTTSWKNYAQVPMVVAKVPRRANIKRVNFYTLNNKKKTINANYTSN